VAHPDAQQATGLRPQVTGNRWPKTVDRLRRPAGTAARLLSLPSACPPRVGREPDTHTVSPVVALVAPERKDVASRNPAGKRAIGLQIEVDKWLAYEE
jgi:hypothetical protein